MRIREIMKGSRRTSVWLGILFLFITVGVMANVATAETITYDYDNAGQVKKVTYADRATVEYTYDNSGNRTSMTITADVVPPDTLLDSVNPSAGITNITDISFAFSSTETGSTFECRLDGGEWTACDSGTISYSILAEGSHSFAVKATDVAGNEDLTPAIYTWTVDTAPPAAIISYPLNSTGIISSSYTIKGSASDVGSSVSKVEISINGGAWTQASGTINWTYAWTNITPGTYTLKSRATDTAGNLGTPQSITVTAYTRLPNGVATSGRQLLLNGSPFTIKGINYSPVPVGEDPGNPPYGDYFTIDHSAIFDRDLPLIRNMGANTIRLWTWDGLADHTAFLDAAFNAGSKPLYVIVGYHINPGLDLSDADVRNQFKAGFKDMVAAHRNHPGILMWAIGSDLNSAALYGSDLADLFSLIEEMAAEAHATDPNHPVMMPLADESLISTISAYNAGVPSLDIWGANVYRGNSFGNLFTDYQAASAKPLLITGYGIDALNDSSQTEDETAQATYAASLWNEIRAASANCIGGVLSEYSDQWWKGREAIQTNCPEADNPSVHGYCGHAATTSPDGYDNYEWWGIMRSADDGTNPDVEIPRSVYAGLQVQWIPVVLLSPFNTVTTQTPTYTWNAVPGATQYRLYVTDINNTVVTDETFSASTICNSTTCSVSVGVLAGEAKYYWNVRASNVFGYSLWAGAKSFYVTLIAPVGKAVLQAPKGLMSSVPPAYTWTVVDGVTSYRLYVTDMNNVVVRDETFNAATICSGSTCTVSVGSLAGEMKYYWNVRGLNVFGGGPWSGASNFTITASTVPAKPVLNGPSGVISSTTPTYIWNEVSGAANYMLYVSNSSGAVVRDEIFSAADICISGTCSVSTTIPLASEVVYYWTARGYNLAGYGLWGATKTFTVTSATIPGVPTLISPVGVIGTTSPEYSWNEVSGATKYQLYVTDSTWAVVRNQEFATSSICSGGTCTVTTTVPLGAGQLYRWKVRGANLAGYGSYSGTLSFTTP